MQLGKPKEGLPHGQGTERIEKNPLRGTRGQQQQTSQLLLIQRLSG